MSMASPRTWRRTDASIGRLGYEGRGASMQFSSERSQTASPIDVRLKDRHILYYGNFSYGSMSGRDLMAVAIGL